MDKSKIAVNLFDKLAVTYQEKYMDVSIYADTFDVFCEQLRAPDSSILELGCGPGNVTRQLLNTLPGLRILGTDLAPNMLKLAAVNNPGAEYMLLDCREIPAGRRYDGIVAAFCLPYLQKEETVKLIADASGILEPGGLFYLSTMEDDYEKSGLEKGSTGEEIFMHYYSEDFLAGILTQNNFEVISSSRKRYPGRDGKTVTDLILIARFQP